MLAGVGLTVFGAGVLGVKSIIDRMPVTVEAKSDWQQIEDAPFNPNTIQPLEFLTNIDVPDPIPEAPDFIALDQIDPQSKIQQLAPITTANHALQLVQSGYNEYLYHKARANNVTDYPLGDITMYALATTVVCKYWLNLIKPRK